MLSLDDGGNENRTVARLSEIVARQIGIYSSVANRLCTAAALHDIGKLKIDDSILNKPGKLDESEFEIMKTHTMHGAEILESICGELGVMVRTVCMYHHEWYDGSKSYWGKYSCDLPPYVPIVSISDVFTALLSKRSYKDAWPPEEAMEYIHSQAGTQFSPQLAETFISLVRHDERVKAMFTGDCKEVNDRNKIEYSVPF